MEPPGRATASLGAAPGRRGAPGPVEGVDAEAEAPRLQRRERHARVLEAHARRAQQLGVDPEQRAAARHAHHAGLWVEGASAQSARLERVTCVKPSSTHASTSSVVTQRPPPGAATTRRGAGPSPSASSFVTKPSTTWPTRPGPWARKSSVPAASKPQSTIPGMSWRTRRVGTPLAAGSTSSSNTSPPPTRSCPTTHHRPEASRARRLGVTTRSEGEGRRTTPPRRPTFAKVTGTEAGASRCGRPP